jgi:adenylate kinase
MKLLFVSGMRDVDRKTIVELALQRSGRKREFTIIDFDKIEDVGEDVETLSDLGSARRLISKFYERVEKDIITRLKEQSGSLIVSGYLTFKTRHGYIRAVPDDFFHAFKPDTVVLLERHPDFGEKADHEKLEQQQINRYFGTIYSSFSGSSFKIIRFKEKRMLEAVNELSDIIRY